MRRARSLLESLKENALEASYRERVHGRLTARRREAGLGSAGLGNLQRELLAEMASALGYVLARHYSLPPKRPRTKASGRA